MQPNYGLDPYSSEAAEIERNRRYAEAMREQAGAPIQPYTVGGMTAPISWTQGMAKLVQGLSAGSARRQAEEQEKALRDRIQGDRTSDMQSMARALQGAPATSETIVDEQANGGMGAPATINAPGRPAGQIDPSMLGQLRSPEMQQLAMSLLVKQMQPKAPIKAGPGDQLIDPTTFKPVYSVPNKPDKPAAIPSAIQEYEYAQKQGFKGTFQDFEIAKRQAGASKTVTNVNSFTPASEEAQKDFIRSSRATYDQIKQAPVLIESIEKAKALIPSAKGFMGPGGETLLDASKFLNNRLGMNIDPKGVKSAEELRTRIFFNIMDNLKKMDAQPSQQQQQIMQEALGKLGTDPNALPAVLDAFSDVIKGKVSMHNKEVQSAIDRGVKFPYDPLIKLPTGGGGGGGAPMYAVNPQTKQRIMSTDGGKTWKPAQ